MSEKKVSKVKEYIESLRKENDVMEELRKNLEQKRKDFKSTNIKTEFLHFDEKYERAIYDFEQSIKPEVNTLKEHDKKMASINTTHVASACLRDIIDEICRIRKMKRQNVIVDVETPTIYFNELTMPKLEKLMEEGKISTDFEIVIYNKNYIKESRKYKIPRFFYSKKVSLNHFLKFSDGKKLHDIAYTSTRDGKTEVVFKTGGIENLILNFTVKELMRDNSEWEPSSLIYEAVVNCAHEEFVK